MKREYEFCVNSQEKKSRRTIGHYTREKVRIRLTPSTALPPRTATFAPPENPESCRQRTRCPPVPCTDRSPPVEAPASRKNRTTELYPGAPHTPRHPGKPRAPHPRTTLAGGSGRPPEQQEESRASAGIFAAFRQLPGPDVRSARPDAGSCRENRTVQGQLRRQLPEYRERQPCPRRRPS